jgi:hypothetical protein
MKTTYITLLAAALLPCLAGCISNPMALAPVGPGAIGHASSGTEGFLQVFTATTKVDTDFESYFYPHLGYDVEDLAGKTVKFVANHDSDMDEVPDTVSLPPGHYKIVAMSTWCGLVTVPVSIEPGQTTIVHLDGNGRRPANASPGQLVYLPNGEVVGWSSSNSKSLQ